MALTENASMLPKGIPIDRQEATNFYNSMGAADRISALHWQKLPWPQGGVGLLFLNFSLISRAKLQTIFELALSWDRLEASTCTFFACFISVQFRKVEKHKHKQVHLALLYATN